MAFNKDRLPTSFNSSVARKKHEALKKKLSFGNGRSDAQNRKSDTDARRLEIKERYGKSHRQS